jgi:hypothetical protein
VGGPPIVMHGPGGDVGVNVALMSPVGVGTGTGGTAMTPPPAGAIVPAVTTQVTASTIARRTRFPRMVQGVASVATRVTVALNEELRPVVDPAPMVSSWLSDLVNPFGRVLTNTELSLSKSLDNGSLVDVSR